MIRNLKAVVVLCCILIACSSSNQKEESNVADYTIETAEYNVGKVHVKYPQVNGLSGNRDEQVNEMIRRIIIDEYVGESQEFIQSENERLQRNDEYIADLSYEIILKDSSTISILLTGKSSYSYSSFPISKMKGITINLDTLTLMNLEEFIDIDIDFMSKLKNYTYVYQSYESVLLEHDNKDKETMDNPLKISEYIDSTLLADDYFIYITFKENLDSKCYYDYVVSDSKIYIRITVAHAAGDYALIEIDRD